jgi:ABC-type transporter Mla subunit MlaD
VSAPANRWKLGLFVVAGCAATITGLTWIGVDKLKREFFVAYAFFDEAVTGLEEGSPVKFRGVTIGRVDEIVVADDQKHLRVQLALYVDRLRALRLHVGSGDGDANGDGTDEAFPLPPNLRAQIVMSWVTSTSFIQVDYYKDPPRGMQVFPFAVPINTLRTVPSTAKSLEDAAREVLRELPALATTARELVETLRTELSGARLPDLSRDLQAVLQRIDGTFAQLEKQATVATLNATLKSIDETAASLRDDKGALGRTLAEARELLQTLQNEVESARLADTTAAVREATSTFGTLGSSVSVQIASLRATLDAVERLATMLERDPGALLHGRTAPRSPLQEQSR